MCLCVRGGSGHAFPWQDPWDTAEGRVQPLKESLHAWQSISGSHLHNKWSAHVFFFFFPPALTRVCTHRSRVYPLSAHQHTPTQGQRNSGWVGGTVRETEQEASYFLEWYSTNANSVAVSVTRATKSRGQRFHYCCRILQLSIRTSSQTLLSCSTAIGLLSCLNETISSQSGKIS